MGVKPLELKRRIDQAVAFLKTRIPCRPRIGIVLGSGLGRVCEAFEVLGRVEYREIPFFPVPTVLGHKGQLLIARRKQRDVLVMMGRVHFYEGYAYDQITFPIRVAHRLGVRMMILTNSAGSVREMLKPGDIMLIRDQIGAIWNPAFGKPADLRHKPYYSERLIAIAQKIGLEKKIPLKNGVLFGWKGPTYETHGEASLAARFGGDAVTMSTIPEVICCNMLGMEVIGISLITNIAGIHKVGHNGVVGFANRMSSNLAVLIAELVERM